MGGGLPLHVRDYTPERAFLACSSWSSFGVLIGVVSGFCWDGIGLLEGRRNWESQLRNMLEGMIPSMAAAARREPSTIHKNYVCAFMLLL